MPKPKRARKVGRPRLPNGAAKGKIVPVRFNASDLKAITKAARAKGQTLSEWIRSAVMIRNVERLYASCQDGHIILFEVDRPPQTLAFCIPCGRAMKIGAVSKGYVSYDEANKGWTDVKPSGTPNAEIPPKRL